MWVGSGCKVSQTSSDVTLTIFTVFSCYRNSSLSIFNLKWLCLKWYRVIKKKCTIYNVQKHRGEMQFQIYLCSCSGKIGIFEIFKLVCGEAGEIYIWKEQFPISYCDIPKHKLSVIFISGYILIHLLISVQAVQQMLALALRVRNFHSLILWFSRLSGFQYTKNLCFVHW